MKLFPSSSRRFALSLSSLTSSLLLLSGFFSSTIVIVVNAADVYYDWELHAVLSNDYSVDCMNMKDQGRNVFLAEDSYPGPVIDVNEGDTVHVRVTNMHPTSAVSIHYHGMHMIGTPYSDGPAGVTQCALGPGGQSQEHVFVASPAGTHFWHSHAGMHIADGITGPLIVRPVNEPEPFQYDEERIMFLQDWYIKTGTQQMIGLESLPFVWVGNPQSFLINGKGLAPQCMAPDGISFNDTTMCLIDVCANATTMPYLLDNTYNVTTVESGKTYRFRIINSAQLIMFNYAIANHTMTVVAVEGTYLANPYTVESLDVAPGERYDVLVTANQDPGTVYWIETMARYREVPGVFGRALLKYASAVNDTAANATANATEAADDDIIFSAYPNHPEWNNTEPGIAFDEAVTTANVETHTREKAALTADEADIVRFILVGTQNQYFVEGVEKSLAWAVNNISNVNGMEPFIGTAVMAARELGWPTNIEGTEQVPPNPPVEWNYSEKIDFEFGGPGPVLGTKASAVINLEKDQVFELVMQNTRAINGVAEFHPWHSHGYSFWVVGSGFGPYNPETDIATYNLENPILRDTATLLPLEWKAFRFIADNPGVWYFHCHIMAHEAMGMALKIVVQPDLLEEPSDSVRFCTLQGLEPDDNPQEGDDTDEETGASPEQEDNPQDGDDSDTTSRGSSMQTSLFLAAAAVQLTMTLLF